MASPSDGTIQDRGLQIGRGETQEDAMGRNGGVRQIKRVRNEVLVALKMLYPAALQGDQVLRTLLAVFPQLEWDQLKKDLAYLCEKGYVQRIVADTEEDARMTAWRKRWFRLTSSGVEVADHCVEDKALEV
ncbi:MAG: hypothetical protein ACUVXJ_12140 [Phycisphaerae bacterium]